MNEKKELESVPASDRLWDLYKVVIDEYRFQVSLNWQRAQYLLVLNLGLVGLGTGLLGIERDIARFLTGLLFAVGVMVTLASVRAITLQHEYYRDTRKRKFEIEKKLGLSDFAPRPTPRMREEKRASRRNPWRWNVTDLIRALLVLLTAVDGVAAVAVFWSL